MTAASDFPQASATPVPNEETPAGADGGSSIANEAPNNQLAHAMLLFDPLLATLAIGLDDIERVRIAQANRFRILTTTKPDEDGVYRGFGLDTRHPSVASLEGQLRTLEALEHEMVLAMGRQFKLHPLYPWIKAQRGIGDKQAARLLHAIRDPYWNDLHDRPRTVSELWAYCGLHVLPAGHYVGEDHLSTASRDSTSDADHARSDPHYRTVGVAARRKKGVKANWSSQAKTRSYLVAEACMKQLCKPCARADGQPYAVHVDGCVCGPYRVIYDAARAKYAEAIHRIACAPCSALPGSPLRDGHKHARALRLVQKEVLKDLWIESKRIYELAT